MIHLSPEARLTIILPNTNRALGEAIKNATPEQLETLKEGKDIKSLLTSVFQDKTTASKSDQTLLDLLKNSSAFKNMGSFSDSLQSLLKEMKSSPDMAPKTAILENFLKNITTLNPQNLKSQISSSGVFMESKFAAALNKIPNLAQNLETLKSLLAKIPTNDAKALQNTISTLLSSPMLPAASTNLQSALQLTEGVKKIAETLQTLISKTDPLYSKEVAALALKLDQQSATAEIKTTLSQIYGTLLSSTAPDTNTLLDSIEKLLKNLNSSSTEEVKTFTRQLDNAISEGDTTKDLTTIKANLSEFANPKELVTEIFLKESMSDDLKSNLLTLREELYQSNDPSAPKLLEQTDKLLTQIDYHQMLSHLSASNSIYLPFAWDQLQEGSLTFKQTNKQKFYCEINLLLKEYGELDLMMGLYDDNQIEIQAHTEKPQLKTLIHENIAELRSLLIKSGLTPRSIRVFEAHEIKTPLNETYNTYEGSDMGFEVKV
ncbi:MAG: flagellar hook-length control protein FliK [Sulfuricurvum sp.]|uniref:flagellar hook-length control protein FliK n=1 Tax=Sulfuricurvum sp. TaxID=2025608 RepID=UPI0025F6E079|nr:flagellar hook-length control protein FliK [Sulfuricurvum sp.]MBV5321273.1 flagellar hook-length control protein FliK [Sulfuricurvum sp.]